MKLDRAQPQRGVPYFFFGLRFNCYTLSVMLENKNCDSITESGFSECLRGNGKIWLYGGISVAVIIVGIVTFFFATQIQSPQAKAPTSSASAPSATFPTGGTTPDIVIGMQKVDSGGKSLVVQWENLPSGTTEIGLFHMPTEGTTSVLVADIKIPSSSLPNGSSSLKLPSGTQEEYYYGTASSDGGPPLYTSPPAPPAEIPSPSSTPSSTPPGGDQGPSSSTDGNPPSQGGGSPSSTPSSTPPSSSSSDFYYSCAAGQCVPTSTPGATSCDAVCSINPESTVLTAACSPSLVPVGQTSQCVLDLNGVPQNDVTWTVAFESTGSVSAAGVYAPSATGTEMIVGTLPDNTSADATVTALPNGQSGSCDFGYVLIGSSCVLESGLPIQSSLTWNGNNYSVENGLYTSQDAVYISGLTDSSISSVTVYCSYARHSVSLLYLGSGNYEISGLSSHGCNTPNSINYLDLGGFSGNGLNISINAPN